MTTLELGTTLTDGVRDKLTPVVRDGVVVASLRSTGWQETVAATVGDRAWAFTGTRDELRARLPADPDGSARFRARHEGWASDLWSIELHEVPVVMELESAARGTHRFTCDGRTLATTVSSGWQAALRMDVEADLPLDQQVFLLWVALVTRRRNRSVGGV